MILPAYEMNRWGHSFTFIVICYRKSITFCFYIIYFKIFIQSFSFAFINSKWDTSPLWSSQWQGERSRLVPFWTVSHVLRLLNWCQEDVNQLLSEKKSTWLTYSKQIAIIYLLATELRPNELKNTVYRMLWTIVFFLRSCVML